MVVKKLVLYLLFVKFIYILNKLFLRRPKKKIIMQNDSDWRVNLWLVDVTRLFPFAFKFRQKWKKWLEGKSDGLAHLLLKLNSKWLYLKQME